MSSISKSTYGLNVATVFLSSLALFNAVDASAENNPSSKSYELTATASIATDYLFRGVSQTLEDPAVQASFDISHVSGVFAGIWSSNVDSQDRGPSDDQADQEIDLYVGYGTAINNDWSVDATAIRYIFPGTASDSDLDWNELLGGLHYRDSISFLIGYSNKVFNIDETAIYYGVSGSFPLSNNINLTASAGYYDLDDALNDSYTDFSIGAEMTTGMFTSRLAYVDTNSSGEDLFGDNAQARVVFCVTAAMGN